MKEVGHDVECKEVTVDTLSTHRCLQKSLVFIHRQSEQGEALWALGSPGRSHKSWKNRKWAYYRGPVTPLASTQLTISLQGRDSNSILQRKTGSERESHLPRGIQQGRIRWVPRSV